MSDTDKELKLCNCDGDWHVEIDGTTHYVDVSDVNQIEEEIQNIVHLCACQAMNTDDLERVEELEARTVKELIELFNKRKESK